MLALSRFSGATASGNAPPRGKRGYTMMGDQKSGSDALGHPRESGKPMGACVFPRDLATNRLSQVLLLVTLYDHLAHIVYSLQEGFERLLQRHRLEGDSLSDDRPQ